jgi:hypothetical protein
MFGSVEAGLADWSSLSSLSLLIASPEKYNDSSPASAQRQAGPTSVVFEPRCAASTRHPDQHVINGPPTRSA